MNQASISNYEAYLYLSYLPDFRKASLEWLNCNFNYDSEGMSKNISCWIKGGIHAFRKAMIEEISATSNNAMHVVLLSGGLDSRVILGELMGLISKSQIIVATYGIPGSWDFEIAKLIAHKYGLRHEMLNLLDEKWDIDQLVTSAKRLTDPVSVYQSHARQQINNRLGPDCIYWSGLMGDSLAGSDLPRNPSINKRDVITRHIDLFATPNFGNEILYQGITEWMMRECDWDAIDQKKLTLDQQFDFGVRQYLLTKPIVIVNGFHFKTPFLNKAWTSFVVNVPYKWLLNKFLYKQIIEQGYKELAALPSTATAGMPVYSSRQRIFVGRALAKVKPYFFRKDPFFSHPRTNYINWSESLCHRGNLQETVYMTLQELKKRNNLDSHDIDGWWQEHLTGRKDLSTLLMNLSSMELLFEAGIM